MRGETMDLAAISRHATNLQNVFEGLLEADMQRALERLTQDEQWELMAIWAITAAEVPARRMITRLLERERFRELVWPACLRRQVRRQEVIIHDPTRTRRIFRDIDAEENEAGVPEHILQEAQEIAEAADASRMAALMRDARVDHDPLRELIVQGIAEKLNTAPEAAEALLVIAKASPFEDTRRLAAMKLANNELVARRLAREGRWADLIVVAKNAELESVRTKIARALGPVLGNIRAQKDWDSLRWVGAHHPDPKAREAIAQVLSEEAQEQGPTEANSNSSSS